MRPSEMGVVIPILLRTGRIAVAVAAVGWWAGTANASGYEFLGDLRAFERGESGGVARCAPDAALRLRFVADGILRVTLERSGRKQQLLTHALARQHWDPVAVTLRESDQSTLLASKSLRVELAHKGCRLTVSDAAGKVLIADDPGLGIGWDGNEVRNWKRIAEDERFFGLGEKTGDVDKRGHEWVMWNSDIPGYGNDTDPLYQSIPFLAGLREGRAWGLFLNNSHRSRFNLGAGNHRYWSFAAEGGALDYFVFAGPRIADVVRAYTGLTGRMPLPPKWALGYQQSRWSYYPDREVLSLAREFRERKIPADVIYLDIHYMDDYRVFTWHPERFPQPDAMLHELGGMGFKPVVIVDPGVKQDPNYAIAREGLAGDHFVRYPDGEVYVGSVWPGRAYFPDFARAETRAWWGGHLAGLRAHGVRGIWNDMNEPAVWGKAFPDEVLMQEADAPASFKRMHNLYGHLMAQGTYEGLRQRFPDERPFVLTRAGFAGTQRWSAVWTGDNVASWEHLALGIRMMLGLGLSGAAFNGTDVGGFEGTPSGELYARWMQVGAFSPLFRAHTTFGTPGQEPWAFGERIEAIASDAIRLRYRLLPYLYTLFAQAHRSGAPIMRPLFWHYPNDANVYAPEWQQQFLVGERLLVAPVLTAGSTLQRVYLPAGRWLELGTETVHDGGQAVVIDTPLERIPTFLAEGGILPLGEVTQYVGEHESTMLTLEVFAGATESAFDLYEDDGSSHAYEDGGYRITRLRTVRRGDALTLSREVVHDGYRVSERTLDIRLHDIASAPRRVTLNGTALHGNGEHAAWAYDARQRRLTVHVSEAGGKQTLAVHW